MAPSIFLLSMSVTAMNRNSAAPALTFHLYHTK
jgi:hypothetical protein